VTVAANPRELREAHARASAAGLKVLVQELIPGPDHLGVNYNAFRARGTVHAECTARKVRLTPPRFGMPSVVLSDDVPEVVEPARAMLGALDLEGFANGRVQARSARRDLQVLRDQLPPQPLLAAVGPLRSQLPVHGVPIRAVRRIATARTGADRRLLDSRVC
jgi:hypothetical protein